MTHTSPEDLFGEILAYVEKAKGMLAAGEWVDLKGLDRDVEALCLSVAALSSDQAREYGPELEYLREQVGVLGDAIHAQRHAVKGEIKGTEALERANKAYAQGKSLSGDGKP